MTLPAARLLRELATRGVTIRAEGGELRLRPASAIADLIPDLRERKPELLELLSLPLADRVLELLSRDSRHTTRSLALALGRPRDEALYDVLGKLLEERRIESDPVACDFFARPKP